MADRDEATPRNLLKKNIKRRVDNPLRHYDLAELNEIAIDFAHRVDGVSTDDLHPVSPNKELFTTAARIAFDPPNWKSVCTDEEIRSWETGRSATFWRQPRALRATVVALCLSALIQGFCQSILNGSNQTLPQDFGLVNEHHQWRNKASLWIFAGLNGIVYLTAGLCGCFLSDPLQSTYLGRRGAVLAAASLCFASVIGGAFTRNWQQLMICRALLGVGLGAKASVTPMFCAEVSPSNLRGTLVINWQIFDALGIFLGFNASLALASTGLLSWRLQTASACIPAAFLMILVWNIPESPRWLLKKGRYAEAFASMCDLRGSQLEAATELLYADEQVQAEKYLLPAGSKDIAGTEKGSKNSPRFQDVSNTTSYWTRFAQLFRDQGTRRATIAAAVVMLGQQLCGINILAFYSTTFFRDVKALDPGSISTYALWLSWGIGLANFVFAFPAYALVDTRGRRFLLLTTYPGMAVSMLGACLSSLNGDDHTRLVLICIFLFLFVLFYSFGQGPVAFAYASEVFPLLNREAGMSFSVFVNLTGAGLLTLFVPLAQLVAPHQVATPAPQDPIAQDKKWRLLQVYLLAAFTVLNVVAFLLIFLFVPETARAKVSQNEGKLHYLSLEEIRYIFGVPTSQHIHEQIHTVIPGAWKSFKSTLVRVIPRSFRTRSRRNKGKEEEIIEELPWSLFPEFDFDFPPITWDIAAETSSDTAQNQ